MLPSAKRTRAKCAPGAATSNDARALLYTIASRIYSGTSEIQRMIIAPLLGV